MSLKVMFIYPNSRCMNMLPRSVGILSALLKQSGFQVRLFDTTYYQNTEERINLDTDKLKSEHLMVRPSNMSNLITLKTTNAFEDLEKEVKEFGPDLLALSATEDMWPLGIKLLKKIRYLNILTIAGGVFPTFAPELALSYPEIDIVCKGEGENALLTLCECLENGQTYDDISNLWIKRKNGTIKTNPIKMVDMNANPLIDMSLFEEERFYRPMGGKVYRMFPVGTFRGCPYTCAFCNSPSQTRMYQEEEGKSYLRRKSFKKIYRELKFYKDDMKAEYLYFCADTFFSWKKGEFEEFAEMYKEIGLPFLCQTRIETVTPEKLKLLKEIGCARLSFGIEHGNEEFRKRWLLRFVTNESMINNFKNVKDSGIPFSVNNIVGFPHETRELAFDTIRLNRHVDADDRSAYTYTPFHGTPLRVECEKLGLIKNEDIVQSVVSGESLLDMPQFSKKEVQAIVKTFNMYVKFPESRWSDIKKAEEDSPEGQKIYKELKQEFMDKFFDVKKQAIKGESSDVRKK